MYDKYRELQSGKQRHRLQGDLRHYDEIMRYASTKLRVEPRLLNKYLRNNGLDKGGLWTPNLVQGKLQELAGEIQVNDLGLVVPEAVRGLCGRDRAVALLACTTGYDVRDILPSSTLYDTRKRIKNISGIEILAEASEGLSQEVHVDLQAALQQGRWAGSPEWWYQEGNPNPLEMVEVEGNPAQGGRGIGRKGGRASARLKRLGGRGGT